MDFIDWRKQSEKRQDGFEAVQEETSKFRSRRFNDYIEEIIQEALDRGDFANLAGSGKPLQLEDDHAAGDKAMAYRVLKNSGMAPPEIELAKEIRTERERIEAKLAKVMRQGQRLRSRRVAPFASEKHAFNTTVEKVLAEYERTLRQLNSKILTLNLTTPAPLHQPTLQVELLVHQFRAECPLFEV